jgi:hypothetical protein
VRLPISLMALPSPAVPSESGAISHVRQRPRMFPERRYVGYEFGSTTFATTQRCLPILRSRTKPSPSYVDRAP